MSEERLVPEMIRYAYSEGAFPMGEDDGTIRWYRPFQRALLPIEGIHVSRSLQKTLRKDRFEIRFDTAFEQVMRSCLRPPEEGNWINEEIIRVYTEVFRQGWGHCCECWQEGRLVGGVYGVALGSCFCAESMFHRATDASKVALWAMVNRCRELGFTMFDAQIMNRHLESLGAFAVSNRAYLRMLRQALTGATAWSLG